MRRVATCWTGSRKIFYDSLMLKHFVLADRGWSGMRHRVPAKRSRNRRFWPTRSAKTTSKSGSISAGEPHTFYTSLSYILGYCAYLNSVWCHKGPKTRGIQIPVVREYHELRIRHGTGHRRSRPRTCEWPLAFGLRTPAWFCHNARRTMHVWLYTLLK